MTRVNMRELRMDNIIQSNCFVLRNHPRVVQALHVSTYFDTNNDTQVAYDVIKIIGSEKYE